MAKDSIKPYIDDLFGYLDTYEKSYSDFEVEAFFQTYGGIYAVFQAMREQRQRAMEVDRYFLDKIRRQPLNSSDLRQLTIQVLVTYFESEADTDGQSNQAYLYCRELRSIKRDAAYFEEQLVPLLFREGSLNNDFRLNEFFLKEIGRYLSKFARALKADLSPEDFASMSEPMKFLELTRRRQDLGRDLLADRNSLEFQLQSMGLFNKLRDTARLYEQYLGRWGYLAETGFWVKFKGWLSGVWGKFKGLFASFRFFRLTLTQRKPAYVLYLLIILVFAFLAYYVPVRWNQYSQQKLERFEQRAVETQNAVNR